MADGKESTKLIHKGGSRFYVYVLTSFATLGGLLFGYDTGIVSGSMLLIKDDFKLSTIWQEIIVSATIGAAALFSLVAGILVDKIGRKKVIMFASVVFTVGAVVMAITPTDKKEVLLTGRLIVGVGIGFASMSVPVYVAEAAPTNIRGSLVTLNQLFITVGILLSSIIAGTFSSDKTNGWRYMYGLAGIPGVIQFFGFLFLPESPRWLMGQERYEEARRSLSRIRGTSDVDDELDDIQKIVREEREHRKYNVVQTVSLMLATQPVRRALVLGCLLQLFQQLCGINTVIYYSASILRMSGFPSEKAIWLVCIPNSVNMLCTFIGIYFVERLGRRLLTLLSFVGIIIALVVLGTGFTWLIIIPHLSATCLAMAMALVVTPTHFFFKTIRWIYEWSSMCTLVFRSHQSRDGSRAGSYSSIQGCSRAAEFCSDCIDNDDCGFCFVNGMESTSGTCLPVYKDHPERYAVPPPNSNVTYRCDETDYEGEGRYHWANDYCPTPYGWMSVLGLALFVIAFAPGLGPNPWTINAEIYPLWARGSGISIATAVNWLANLCVSLTFLTLLETITRYGTFFLFCGISCLGLVILYFILPETKNKSLEEVMDIFMSEEYRRQKPDLLKRLHAESNASDKSDQTQM